MKARRVLIILALSVTVIASLSGCGSMDNRKKVIHISNGQPEDHPVNVGLRAFEEYVEENLGDKYDVEIYPNELLGSTSKAIELVQTGAIEYVVANTSNLETFNDIYQIFSLPYLFDGREGFDAVVQDDAFMSSIYESTDSSGFRAVTWFDLGERNLYTRKPVYSPDDLKGMKIRVQPSTTNVRMIELMGGAAVPMSYSEVYSALQQGVIDGAENSEIALTTMKHGEVAPYYTYDQHQIMPDVLVGNLKFLKGLSDEEKEIFDEAARICTEVEVKEWKEQIAVAKEQAVEMGEEFIETDIEPFRDAVMPLHAEILEENPKLQPLYDEIQKIQENAVKNTSDTGQGGKKNE